jgi:Phospholipase/Carboxylesterase.
MESKSYKVENKNKDIYITPKDGKHTETMIFMHGLGDTAAGWLDVFVSDDMTPCLPVI